MRIPRELSTGMFSCRAPEVPRRMICQEVRVGFYLACFKIYIYECVQFVEHDIDIIGADAGRNYGEAFVTDIAGVCYKFTVLVFAFYFIKVFAYCAYTVRGRLR